MSFGNNIEKYAFEQADWPVVELTSGGDTNRRQVGHREPRQSQEPGSQRSGDGGGNSRVAEEPRRCFKRT